MFTRLKGFDRDKHSSLFSWSIGDKEKKFYHIGTRGKALNNEETFEPFTSIQFNWKVDLLKCIDATPTVVETSATSANVYVGSHSGFFVAVELQSGKEVWYRCH
jgi:hypothetical protein